VNPVILTHHSRLVKPLELRTFSLFECQMSATKKCTKEMAFFVWSDNLPLSWFAASPADSGGVAA
jgi:hypothetical protein